MDSERELKFLAGVWALRGILTRPGFKKFKLKDRLVGSDKGELDDLLDYVKAKETPATVQLLSANSRTTIEKGVEAVTLTRNGVFFKNFAHLGKLLKLTVAEGDILLFVMLWREEPGLRQALDELNSCGVQEFYDHLARILKVPEVEIRLAVRKDGTLASAGLVQVYKGIHRSVELEPLDGLYKALSKSEGGVEGILGTYFTKSPTPTLSLEDFAYHPDLSLLVRYVRQAVKRREPGTNVLLYGSPGREDRVGEDHRSACPSPVV